MKKKFSFTKLIMAFMMACNFALIIFTCYMVWETKDLSPLCYLSLGEGGAFGVWLGSYAWKERAANRSKYAMEYVDKFAEKYGIDAALQIAQTVLQE